MLKSDCGVRRFANMSAPAPNAAVAAKGSTTSTATTKRSIPTRLPHRPISPSASFSLQKRPTKPSSSATSLTSRHVRATTTTRTVTATRSAAAPALSHDTNRKGLEGYLPRLQAASNRDCPAAPSGAPHPLPEGRVPPRYLPTSSVKASVATGAAETGVRAAFSHSNHLISPMRGGAALGSSPQRASRSLEASAEEKDSDDRQQDRSPMRPLAGLPQRTQELCEELITLDSLVEADEAFFSMQSEMESQVMELLRLWREATLSGDSRGGSGRPSGVHTLATASAPSAVGTHPGDAVASSNGGGGVGTQRVLQDFKEARERIALLASLHEELTELEEQHRGLQRRYIVENSPLAALDELSARLDEEDEEALEDGTDACTVKGAEQVSVGAYKDGRSKMQPWQGRGMVRAGLAACRLLTDRLRSRCMMIGDRLTDELLLMRSEMAQHDWTSLQVSTPLTQMERVVSLDARDDHPITSASASRSTSLFLPPGAVTAVRRDGKDSADLFANSNAARFSDGVGGARDGDGNEPDLLKKTMTTTETRESFVLRVHVPVFASATPPALATTVPAGLTTGSEGATEASGGYTPRAGGDGLCPMGTAERVQRRPSGGAQALSNASTTTVSVIASPTRYALVQLYECCREGLATMLTRLCALRARRCKEAEQLQQEQSAMDVYDPAADDLAERCEALLRYVGQLDQWAGEVLQMDQVLHERVKLPLDAALQTYERLRTQLLEVLKQRLEDEEDRDNEHAATGVDAEEDGGEVDDGDERLRAREVGNDDGGEGLRAWKVEGIEGNGDSQHRMSGSVGNDRAHRETQPPAKASSGAAPPTTLPRASAEFLVMLEELLQEQQAACKHLSSTSPCSAGDRSSGERRLDISEHSREEDASSKGALALEQRPPAAEGHDEDTNALVDAKAPREAEHLRIPPAAHSCTTTTVTTGKASPSEAAYTTADGPSTGVDAGHFAGRRRQRDDGDGKTGGAPSHCALPDTVQERHVHLLDPSAAEALSREIDVHVSSKSCSELGDELVEGTGAEQSVFQTEGGARRLPHMPGHERDDSDANDNDSDSDSDDDSRSSGVDGDSDRSHHQRQRYAIGSGSGFGEGLRAFFSAVVRRAMSFDDSDDDTDEAKRATASQGRQPGSTSPAPLHKRARRE